MTEDHTELNLCPNCGKENLPMATRCVHCGSDMESLFTIFGQPQDSDEKSEDSLPDIIEEIRNDPSLKTPAEVAPIPEIPPAEQIDGSVLNSEELPDWLAKVRERAQEEGDAIGDLASGTIAMDAARSEEASAGVEGEFNAWINRIREKSQQENSIRARQLPDDSEDSDQVPEWLQRIRALRPQPEEEITHEVKTNPGYVDEMPREWTDEALEELRRQALAEDQEQETEPLTPANTIAEERELSAEPEMEELSEPVQKEPELLEEDFHNIPDDEEELQELLPEDDLSHSSEAEETIAEEAMEDTLEPGEIVAPQDEPDTLVKEALEEPGQDIPQQGDIQLEEPEPEESISEEAPEEAPIEPDEPEQTEPKSSPAENEPESVLEEQDEEPEEEEQPTDSAAVPPDLLLLRDQQDRASLLASLIEQEGRVTAGKQAIQKPSGRGGRLAVTLLLLIGLVVSILIGPAAMPADAPKSIPALALNNQIQTLTENDQVLIVLDYQAATSRELEALAVPLLEQLHTQGANLVYLTTQPSGLFLAQSLLEQAGLAEDTLVEYLPGSYLSLISRAINPAISDGQGTLSQVKDLRSFRLVLLVSDSSDNIRGWLEQIAPWIESLNCAAVTTQMEAPVLLPYFDSGQLVGYAAGIADGNIGSQPAFSYRAYRVGLLLMLVMLLLGIISKGEADAIQREEERAK
jgi:hypothetical protein